MKTGKLILRSHPAILQRKLMLARMKQMGNWLDPCAVLQNDFEIIYSLQGSLRNPFRYIIDESRPR